MRLQQANEGRLDPLRGKPVGHLVVQEVYRSVQGESTFAGLPCVFVRLTACLARCTWCDTPHAFKEGTVRPLGEVLTANFEALDKIARSAKLTPFTAFADNRPIPDDFDGDPDELAEVMGEWTEWFDPAEGLAAMQALADHIKGSPKDTKRLDGAGGVVEELREMARVLGVAAKQGARFRLQMS